MSKEISSRRWETIYFTKLHYLSTRRSPKSTMNRTNEVFPQRKIPSKCLLYYYMQELRTGIEYICFRKYRFYEANRFLQKAFENLFCCIMQQTKMSCFIKIDKFTAMRANIFYKAALFLKVVRLSKCSEPNKQIISSKEYTNQMFIVLLFA